jgi:hypothetical protein
MMYYQGASDNLVIDPYLRIGAPLSSQHRIPEQERVSMPDNTNTIITENRARCICEPCPTYNECMRAGDELLFCVVGKSPTCTFDKKGCLCPTCPVTPILGLKKAYYCIRGSEKEQK